MWAFLNPEKCFYVMIGLEWPVSKQSFIFFNLISTFTSQVFTPLASCFNTSSAHQFWYSSATKHFALLLTDKSSGWKRFVGLFGARMKTHLYLWNKLVTLEVVGHFKTSKNTRAFAPWSKFNFFHFCSTNGNLTTLIIQYNFFIWPMVVWVSDMKLGIVLLNDTCQLIHCI